MLGYDKMGRSLQKHPTLKASHYLSDEKKWMNYASVKRKADEALESSGSSKAGDTVGSSKGGLHSNQQQPGASEKPSRTDASSTPENGVSVAPEYHGLRNTENSWLLEIYDQFMSPPMSWYPELQKNAVRFLAVLMRKEEKIDEFSDKGLRVLGPPEVDGYPLTPNMVIEDMCKAEKEIEVIDFYNYSPAHPIPASDLISCFLESSQKPQEKWDLRTRYWGALQIHSTPTGTGRAKIKIPETHLDPRCTIIMKNWETAWIPRGAITQPHIDYYGSMQYNIHISGEKIWVTWPPTDRNLEYTRMNMEQVVNHERFFKAVENLEDMQVHHFLPGEQKAFILEPCQIHAVLTISNASHTGIRVFPQGQEREAIRLMNWHLKWSTEYIKNGLSKYHTRETARSVLEEASTWKRLKKLDREIKKDLEILIKECFIFLELLNDDESMEINNPELQSSSRNGFEDGDTDQPQRKKMKSKGKEISRKMK